MINKVIREIDGQGRLQLPTELVNFSSIKDGKEIAICSMGKQMIKLRKKDDVRNHKVIGIGKLDNKRRLIIPLEIRQQTQEFEVFAFNGDLILKEAHE